MAPSGPWLLPLERASILEAGNQVLRGRHLTEEHEVKGRIGELKIGNFYHIGKLYLELRGGSQVNSGPAFCGAEAALTSACSSVF